MNKDELPSNMLSMSEDEIVLVAAAMAIALGKGRSHRELRNMIDLLQLIVYNLAVIDNQRILQEADDILEV